MSAREGETNAAIVTSATARAPKRYRERERARERASERERERARARAREGETKTTIVSLFSLQFTSHLACAHRMWQCACGSARERERECACGSAHAKVKLNCSQNTQTPSCASPQLHATGREGKQKTASSSKAALKGNKGSNCEQPTDGASSKAVKQQ